MKRFFKILRVFLRLKRKELRGLKDVFKEVLIVLWLFILLCSCVILPTMIISLILGAIHFIFFYDYLITDNKTESYYSSIIGQGLVDLFLLGLIGILLFCVYKFGIFIRSNWRQAKRIVGD